MRIRILAAAAAIVLIPGAAWAQDGLRSASLPERTLAPRLPTAVPDLFRSAPDTYTYARRTDRRVDRDDPQQLWSGFGFSPWGYVWDAGSFDRGAGAIESRWKGRGDPPERTVNPPAPSAPPREWPLPPAPGPGAPKTLYVIPGCYAGDKPPRPDQLRPGCEASKIVEIPPAG